MLRACPSLVPSFLTLLAVALATGCGDSGSSSANGGSGTGGNGACPDNLAPAKNSEFCEGTAVEVDCGLVTNQAHQVCGVPLPEPQGELARSSNVVEFAGSGPPDLSCLVEGSYPAKPGTPQDVTIKGFARIFSAGCNSRDLKITVHRVQADGQLGDAIGTSVVTAADCTDVGESVEVEDCGGPRWECPYEYPSVPTETELAIRTESIDGDDRWSPLIQYNIFIANDEVVAGEWDHDVRALASGDYVVIPQTALGQPIKAGNGAVAGEIHDCGDVRLIDAVVSIDKPRGVLTYFGSDEESPVPDTQARGTSSLGLYAALDVEEGPVTVAAGGLVNGEFVALGQHRVWVYPNTVTSITFKGLRPYQVP